MADQSRFGFKKGERPKDMRMVELGLEGIAGVLLAYGDALEAAKPNADLSLEKIEERANIFNACGLAGHDVMLLLCSSLDQGFDTRGQSSPWREMFPKTKAIAELTRATAQAEALGAPNLGKWGRTRAIELINEVGSVLTALQGELQAMVNAPRPVA